jgi:hypothetical protein
VQRRGRLLVQLPRRRVQHGLLERQVVYDGVRRQRLQRKLRQYAVVRDYGLHGGLPAELRRRADVLE